MLNDQFIGRSEKEVKIILKKLINYEIVLEQIPLKRLINSSDFDLLNNETKQHKFDLVFIRKSDALVIEVNYKHGSKAANKWVNIFVPYLEASKVLYPKKIKPVAINDWDCRSLFKHTKSDNKPILVTDVIDVCDALYSSGVKTI